MKVVVTGANGFVGAALCSDLESRGIPFVGCSRSESTKGAAIGDINSSTDWSGVLEKGCVVVHTAALAASKGCDEANLWHVNVDGAIALARQAAAVGVKRFIFISSIKVCGEETPVGSPFVEESVPAPEDLYAQSKLEAEKALLKLAEFSDMEVVIIRPPLVYGAEAKGNFHSLLSWVGRGVPLPFGCVRNQRSFISIDNLVEFIGLCVDHPAAVNEVFHVADGEDLSLRELLLLIGEFQGRPARLINTPVALMTMAARLLSNGDVARRLFGSLQVDISKARTRLGWSPALSVRDGVEKACVGSVRSSDV